MTDIEAGSTTILDILSPTAVDTKSRDHIVVDGIFHAVFNQAKELIYIDSGNGEFTGQVVCGVRRNGKTMYRPIASVYPEVLKDTDKCWRP